MIWLSSLVFSVFLYSVDSLLIRTPLLGVQRMQPRSGTSRRVRRTTHQWPMVHDYLSSRWYTISSRQPLRDEKRHRGSRSVRLQQQQQESSTPSFEQSTSAKIPSKGDIKVDAVAQGTAAAPIENILASVPSYKSILTFVVTTAIILLSEPLLSLVDTIAVGHFGTTNQLAALGPATMICDSSIYFLYFLPIATTNRLATAMAQKQSQESIRQIISQNLSVAALFGLAISLSLALFGKRLLQWIILRDVANSSITTLMDVLSHAHSYVLIRSIGATASVMGMVAQAVCLASLDLRTPALAVISASVSNLLGDYFLARKFGSNGAAAATALATVTSATVLLSANRKRLQRSNNRSTSTDVPATNASTATEKDASAFLTLPDKKSFLELFQLAGPIFLLMLGKIICYNAMTLRANGLGVVSMAAHSILLRLFFFFGVFADGLNQAAQTFFPAILYSGPSASTDPSSTVNQINGYDEVTINRKQSSDGEPQVNTSVNDIDKSKNVGNSIITQEPSTTINPPLKELSDEMQSENKTVLLRNQAFKNLLRRMFSISLLISTVNTALSVGLLRNLSYIFTDDVLITDCIRSQSKWLGLSLFLHSFVLTLEGTIIAQRDVAFLAISYLVFLPLLMMRLHYCKVFPAVWQTLLAFQVARLIQFTIRISTARQHNKTKKSNRA